MIDYSVIKSEWDMMNSLFQKAEIEFMICQTYLACKNYGKSKVDINPSLGNRISWEFLIENGYIWVWEEDGVEYCKPTQKLHEIVINHVTSKQ